MRGRIWGAPVALLVAVALVACGDEGGESSESTDFVSEANSLCKQQAEGFRDVALDVGYEFEPEAQIEGGEARAEVRAEILPQLEALEPPAEDAELYDSMLAGRNKVADLAEQALEAQKAEDEAEFAKLQEKLNAAGDAAEKDARELGLANCAGDLPNDDAQAAEDVVREFATTADPETSCNTDALVLQIFIDEGLGGQAKCEKAQEKISDELPSDVKVSSVEGVDDVTANLEFEDVGGKFDGIPSRATLYYMDGSWKIYTLGSIE